MVEAVDHLADHRADQAMGRPDRGTIIEAKVGGHQEAGNPEGDQVDHQEDRPAVQVDPEAQEALEDQVVQGAQEARLGPEEVTRWDRVTNLMVTRLD